MHSRYAEPPVRHSRARFDYGGSNSGLPYDDHYGSDSTSERRFGKKLCYFSFMIRIRFTKL